MSTLVETAASKAKLKKQSQFKEVLKRLSKNKSAMIGLCIFIAVIIVCVFAPVFAPYGPNDMDPGTIYAGSSLAYTSGGQVIHAVSNVSLDLERDQTLGLVGETGAGKTAIARAALIYAGGIVESGTKQDLFYHPTHPYTLGLFGSLPRPDDDSKRLSPILGLPSDPSKLPDGCKFHPRCKRAREACMTGETPMAEVSPGHFVRCCRCGKDA